MLDTTGAELIIASGLTSTCLGVWGRVSAGLTGCKAINPRAEALTERGTPVAGVAVVPRLGVTLLRGWVGASRDCALAEAFIDVGEVEGSGTEVVAPIAG